MSSASGLSLRNWLEIRDPAVADGVGDRAGERRIRQQQPAPRRDPVGLVVETLGEHLREILDGHRAQQLRVNGGHAVGAVRADDRQVGHADLCAGRLLHQAHALHAALVAREAASGPRSSRRRLISKMISRCRGSKQFEPGERPFLQRLGKQRVVRVRQRSLRDVPGLIPSEMRIVQQNAHQLGNSHGSDACR